MSLIAEIPLIGPTISVVLPFLLVLAIVVFVHEYGHYIVARWCGIGAEAFSVGFGRELYGWTDKRGTRWKISALPLGGYVKFVGDADAASSGREEETLRGLPAEQRARAFHLASVERRAAAVFAGPAANFLLSIAIFAIMAVAGGAPVDEPVVGSLGDDLAPGFADKIEPGDRILTVGGEAVDDFTGLAQALAASDGEEVGVVIARDGREIEETVAYRPAARIDQVRAGSAADAAGLEAGDVVVAVDGEPIDSFSALQKATRLSAGEPMALTVARDGERVSVEIAPEMIEAPDPLTGEMETRPVLGIVKQSTELLPATRSVGPFTAIGFGAERTWNVVALTVAGVSDVVAGREEAGDVLGGPIRIAEISGEAASSGLATFVGLIAVLSTSIGLINLLPIPVLDGGHLMFYAVEKLRGRPLRERWQEIGNGIGLALVLSLMIFATFNDLARL